MTKKRDDGVLLAGTLAGGRVTWDSPVAYTEQLKALGDGRVIVHVYHAGEKALRSMKANRYYRFALSLIAKDTGNDADELHEFYINEFLKETKFFVNRQTGEVSEREIAKRTSRLTPDEFFAFTERVREHAARFFNVNIPDPDPEYWRHRRSAA